MKYILLVLALLFTACDKSAPTPKLAEPQRGALEKARGVEQTLQQASEEAQKEIDKAEGK